MLDARTELELLKHKLRLRGLSEDVSNIMCSEAARDMNNAIVDLLADAMEEAVSAGTDVSSSDFINEITLNRSGSSFEISTQSGRSDFSEAPFPMLPKLLKNAKIAKDGSLYKVIPLKKKTKNTQNRTQVTTEAALQNINESRTIAKEKRDADRGVGSSLGNLDPSSGVDTFAALQSMSNSRKREDRPQYDPAGALIDFKTASSKQDQTKQWVNPGRKADLTDPLRRINMALSDNIDRAIEYIIKKYEDSY